MLRQEAKHASPAGLSSTRQMGVEPHLGPFERLKRVAGDAALRAAARRAYDDLLSSSALEHHDAGDVLAREGDPARHMSVVQEGTLAVYTGDWDLDQRTTSWASQRSVAMLTPALGRGDHWGEVGIANLTLPRGEAKVTPQPTRTANVRAMEVSAVRNLRYTSIDHARKTYPPVNDIVAGLLAVLVKRLTARVAELDHRIPAESRLRSELLRLALTDPDGCGRVNVSQAQLGVAAGLQRARVNALLGREREAGRIATRPGSRGVTVDVERMAAAVDADRERLAGARHY